MCTSLSQRIIGIILLQLVSHGLDEVNGTTPSSGSVVDDNDTRLTINTTNGFVRGFHDPYFQRGLDYWLGIPYAEAPQNKLRFRYPQRIKRWTDVKFARVQPYACYKVIPITFLDFVERVHDQSEDCLYLNIVSPSNIVKDKKLAAVMILLHGRTSLTDGLGLHPENLRTLLLTEQVIIVTVQFREGALGYFHRGTSNAPGNAGLFDQLMALQFIKENIGQFGGDPEKLTLFGDASSVLFHLLSPLSRNLFNRAILLSSVNASENFNLIPKEEAIRNALRLAEHVGCGPINGTQRADVDACLQVEAIWPQFEKYGIPFGPIVDGVFLTEEPHLSLQNANFKQASLLIGGGYRSRFPCSDLKKLAFRYADEENPVYMYFYFYHRTYPYLYQRLSNADPIQAQFILQRYGMEISY